MKVGNFFSELKRRRVYNVAVAYVVVAWLLVQVMNRSYRKPLVQAERGGTRGGRARLTSYGRRVLDCYREMEQRSLTAMQEPWKKVRRMLKNSPASR